MSSTPDKGSSSPDPTIDPTKEEPADSAPTDEPEPADGTASPDKKTWQ
jgi:hypothetical protein